MQRNKELINILKNNIERPSSKQAQRFSEKEIIQTGKSLGCDFCPQTMRKIISVHGVLMPIIEYGMISILSDEIKKEPDYYVFGRDGDLIFDALEGLSNTKEDMKGRIHYLKTSMDMKKEEYLKDYLQGIGITKKRFIRGPNMVFIDSGFRGSLFHSVARWSGYNEDISNKYMEGYLMKSTTDNFREIILPKLSEETSQELEQKLKNSPYVNFLGEDPNLNSCIFMQLMPKFTGKFVKPYLKKDGQWDILPKKSFAIPQDFLENSLEFENSENQTNSMSEEPFHINEDFVNPIASMVIQRRTLNYFSRPDVGDRIYNKIKSKPISYIFTY